MGLQDSVPERVREAAAKLCDRLLLDFSPFTVLNPAAPPCSRDKCVLYFFNGNINIKTDLLLQTSPYKTKSLYSLFVAAIRARQHAAQWATGMRLKKRALPVGGV